MNYTHEVTLDINPAEAPPVVRIKQGDAIARQLMIHLTKDGKVYIPEDGVQFLLRCEKPDGHGVILDSEYEDETLGRCPLINNHDGSLVAEIVDQMTVVPGVSRCDICMYKNDQILSTLPFHLHVRRSPDVTSLVVSSDDFRTVSAMIQQARGLMEGKAQSIATLTLSNQWIGSSSPYYQNITVTGYTVSANTKVDLVADQPVIDILLESRTNEIMVVNNSGTLTAYAIGNKPAESIVVQACIYETLPL